MEVENGGTDIHDIEPDRRPCGRYRSETPQISGGKQTQMAKHILVTNDERKDSNMLLFCVSAYLVTGLLFSTLYWMSAAVGKRHDEENTFLQIDTAYDRGD
jgi:hypothetical protein